MLEVFLVVVVAFR